MCSSSTTSGEVFTFMGCRCGERRLGHRFSVCLKFIFLWGGEYHVSAAVYWEGCTPSKVCWAPYEVRCSPLEVFIIWFVWDHYESWGVGSCEPLMVVLSGT